MAETYYKLIGFTEEGNHVNVMIKGTGKFLQMSLEDMLKSKIMEQLEPKEIREICKKAYANKNVNNNDEEHYEGYWLIYAFISVSLCSLFILSNIVGVKPVNVSLFSFEMIVPIAIFVYPISFVLVDILNEFYGLKLARKSILTSTIVSMLFIAMLYLTTLIPSIDSWISLDSSYIEIVQGVTSVFLASIVSYYVSENLNAYTLHKIKEATNSKWLVLRVLVSTTLAAIIDSILFISIAFYNTLPTEVMFTMIISQISFKLLYAIFGVAPIYLTRTAFKRLRMKSHYIT